MKGFFDCLKTSFVIIGTMIGAGFLSGREVYQFFYGTDILFSAISIFILMLFGKFFLLSANLQSTSRIFKPIIVLSYLCNLFIMAGMLSCISTIFALITTNKIVLTVLTILVLGFSNLIQFRGANGLKSVNAVLVPIIIVTIILVILLSGEPNYVKNGRILPIKTISYVGLNIFLSFPILISLGKNKTKTANFFVAFVSSAVLAILILLIFITLNGSDNKCLYADIPLAVIIGENCVILTIYYIVLVFGVLTTLLGAHYSVFNILDNSSIGLIYKIALSVTAFLISQLSFLSIVAYIYPIIGVIGGVLILILAVEQFFFPKKRPKNTLCQPTDTKSPYRS